MVIYRKGALHHVPDALSRIWEEEEVSAIGEPSDPWYLRCIKKVDILSELESRRMGPYPESKGGYAYVVVFRDFFSKWTECVLLRKANAKTIRRALEDTVVYR